MNLFDKILNRINNYRVTSYSQHGEDIIIRGIFETLNVAKPVYVDVGAYHPYKFSNTALLYKNGANGINIEPEPNLYKYFKRQRIRDINLNCGISDTFGELTYYNMSVKTLNTFSEEHALDYERKGYKILEKLMVEVQTLESICLKYLGNTGPDLLCLDAEGMEERILQSSFLKKYKPMVICVETIEFQNDLMGKKNSTLIDFITGNEYMQYADTHINTIFINKDRFSS